MIRFLKKSSKLGDKEIRTFTKVWMNRLLWMFCGWITLSYVLAFMGKEQIAETLSGNIVQFGIATVLGYLLKSFFETRSEENLKFKKALSKVKGEGEEEQ